MSGELLFGPRYRRTYTHHASHSQFLHHPHFRNHIHLWAGVARDILGSLILTFPQEPAVYFHVSPGGSKKTGWVQKKTWWRPVLGSPGLLTCLHQGQEDEEECLASPALTLCMEAPVQQYLQQPLFCLVECPPTDHWASGWFYSGYSGFHPTFSLFI